MWSEQDSKPTDWFYIERSHRPKDGPSPIDVQHLRVSIHAVTRA